MKTFKSLAEGETFLEGRKNGFALGPGWISKIKQSWRSQHPPTAQQCFAIRWGSNISSKATGGQTNDSSTRQRNRHTCRLAYFVHKAGATSRWQRVASSSAAGFQRGRSAGPAGMKLRKPNPPQWTAWQALLYGAAALGRPCCLRQARASPVANPLIRGFGFWFHVWLLASCSLVSTCVNQFAQWRQQGDI